MVVIFWYISDFFTSIFDIIDSLSEWCLILVDMAIECVSFLLDLVFLLPVSFSISSVALVAVAVIYKVLGREGQD